MYKIPVNETPATELSHLNNRAAWLQSAKAHPFTIAPAPAVAPGPGQVLIKTRAVAINPVDHKVQTLALFPLKYPIILGSDVAGEVVVVGSDVTRYKPGDRVTGLTAGFATGKNSDKSFQQYVLLEDGLSTPIPEGLEYEKAVVLPLGVTTAAAGLFSKDFLGLRLPTEPKRESSGEVLLVTGGASSVGISAIQLAVAAGYEVMATASPKNWDFISKFGVSKVFGYRDPDVVEDMVQFVKGKKVVGVLDAVGGPALAQAVEFVQKAGGVKFVATTIPFPPPPEDVVVKSVQALSVRGNEVGKGIWVDYVPKALAAGTLVPAPEPLVAGKGLEAVQAAVDLKGKEGDEVNSKKVVVLLG